MIGQTAARIVMFSGVALVMAAAPPALAGTLSGSAHDFTGSSWSGGRICIACHTTHNSNTTVAVAPLWNHKLTTATYVLYSSTTMKAIVGQPGGLSKLCLSCHDGTVAVDAFGGATGSVMITSPNNTGAAISDDHPIGIRYDTALATANGSLADPSTKQVTIGTAGQSKTGTIAAMMLYGGQLECSSCHDVHNTFVVPSTGAGGMVKMGTALSGLCVACHNK